MNVDPREMNNELCFTLNEEQKILAYFKFFNDKVELY